MVGRASCAVRLGGLLHVARTARSIRLAPLVVVATIVTPSPLLAADADVSASTTTTPAPERIVDRVLAKWRLAVPGVSASSQVVFERELAFEARLEAMASGDAPHAPVIDRHLRSALGRHIAVQLLASFPLDEPPTPREVAERAEEARGLLAARVGGEERVVVAMRVEAIGPDELDTMLRREARATFALERALGVRWRPSEDALRAELATRANSASVEASESLRRTLLVRRLGEALDGFFQRARPRLAIQWARRAEPR
jgi:hypothetical protein